MNDPNKLPILIFPEGTCINNTSVMMFKKGSFEVSTLPDGDCGYRTLTAVACRSVNCLF